MELTNKQLEGLKIAVERYKNKEKYTVISGYAGTGKSTLVRFIIDALEVEENKICYASFTGKAAEVLRKKGNKNSITLHKLLYDNIPKIDGTFVRKPKKSLEYEIVIVDECSMMPMTLAKLLFSHNVYVICLGDSAQLPPINALEDNHLLDNPHICLTEVMRQAADSEIIQVATAIRQGKPLSYIKGNEVQIIPSYDLNTGMLLWADQILVATNATRQKINLQTRQLLNYTKDIENGEKLVCLRNYWEYLGEDENPLINGMIGYVENPVSSFVQLPHWIEEGRILNTTIGNFISDSDEIYNNISIDNHMLLTGERCVNPTSEYLINRAGKTRGILPKEFAYGYAITGHKAQGSEWDKVLVIEEKFPFNQEEHKKWLYTCVTRAKEKIVLVR